jgi:GNAT superfamily N-acetyltransferase
VSDRCVDVLRYVRPVGTWASPLLAAQAAYLRHLGTAAVAETVEGDGIYSVRTGIASNSENGVVSSGNARVGRDHAEAVVRSFSERKVPASWLCAEGEGRAETAAVLESVGCQPERAAWEMRADVDYFDLLVRADTRIEMVASERELDAWLDVAGAGGWFETEHERHAWQELQRELVLARPGAIRLYLALHGERAVGMASAFYAEEMVLLTGVAVLDDSRRQGIGRSLAVTRLREARERGCRLAVLAPSPDGAKLYQALGFETHPQPVGRWFYLPHCAPPAASYTP